MDNLRLEIWEHGEKGEHYAHLAGIDMGSGRRGLTMVAWLPDGVILRNRGAKVWNGIGMGFSSSPATLTRLKFVEKLEHETSSGGRRRVVCEVGRFDKVEEVEYGRHYKAEFEKMMAKALGVAAVSIERPRKSKAVQVGGLCPSCGKRCRGFGMGLACTAKQRPRRRPSTPKKAPSGLRSLLP